MEALHVPTNRLGAEALLGDLRHRHPPQSHVMLHEAKSEICPGIGRLTSRVHPWRSTRSDRVLSGWKTHPQRRGIVPLHTWVSGLWFLLPGTLAIFLVQQGCIELPYTETGEAGYSYTLVDRVIRVYP